MNISILSLFSVSLTMMVYVPVGVDWGIVQGIENAPPVARGVSSSAITSPISLVIWICKRLASECAIPAIFTVSLLPNSAFSICNVIPFSVGTFTLISRLWVSRRLCAVIFHVPSSASVGIPISSVEKLPVPSEKVSVWLDTFPEGSLRVIVILAAEPV